MFGYVKPKPAELLVREYDFYRAAYCGVCRAMRREIGFLSSLSLSYDIVFLTLCRMLLTDRTVACDHRRCIAHPFKKRPCLRGNEALSYGARVSALLTLEKLEDDKKDSGNKKRLRAAFMLPYFKSAAKKAGLAHLKRETEDCLQRLSVLEKENCPSVDAPAAEFGDLLGLVFMEGTEGDTAALYYDVGYHLGRLIYTADAADDFLEDIDTKDYNPYKAHYKKEDFANGLPSAVRLSLMLTLDALAASVEKLPFGNDTAVEHIIKNIVYLGLRERVDCLAKKARRKTNDRSV